MQLMHGTQVTVQVHVHECFKIYRLCTETVFQLFLACARLSALHLANTYC